MARQELLIRRPRPEDQGRIYEILESANFHHVGGSEMPSFPLEDCFVAERGGRVIGVAGYRILGQTTAKTTLLAVDPAHRVDPVALELQRARQEYLRGSGIKTVTTNVDDVRVENWYVRRFGYRRTGRRTAKTEEFGNRDCKEWTGLELDL